MSPSARGPYVKRMRVLYGQAKGRKERGRLLTQVSETLGRGRRQAKRLMTGPEPRLERPFRRREPVYPERLVEVLAEAWSAMQHAWSVRLKAGLRLWMPSIRRRWPLTAEEERLLLAMSPATMDRRLAPYKRRLSRKIYGQTKPGRWLRQTIPIQTESWNVPEPGLLEVDTVSHSGPTAAGLFAYTLNQVDLFSGWVEMRAILGKKSEDIVASVEGLRQALPFQLRGIDSDNGEEFINYELDRYCRAHAIQRFRSRPNKKDDQAHIEQKNGTHVRRLIGWHRYDTRGAVEAMNDLYRNEWRLLSNLFLPSVKLDDKLRVGSKIKRVYEDAKTPLDRLLDSPHGDRAELERLRRLRDPLDPFELSKAVDRKLERVWDLASRGPVKAAPTPHDRPRPQWWERGRDDDYPAELLPDHYGVLARVARRGWRDRYFGTN